jgi:hypothetical protein
MPVAILAELVTPEQFPFLAPAIASGAFTDGEAEAFDFGLLRILDGLETYMQQIATGQPGTIASPDADPAHDRELARDERVKKANERVRDAEAKLRDARQKQREAVAKAKERLHNS